MKRLPVWMLLPLLMTLYSVAHAASTAVPAWFRYDPAHPAAVYDAWRHLSARQSAMYEGFGYVLGGRLVDTTGHPLPAVSVSIRGNGRRVNYPSVITDKNGYFLLYEPDFPEKPSLHYTVAPGYPVSEGGWRYALAQGETQPCAGRTVYTAPDRAFVLLTVNSRNSFTALGYQQYLQRLAETLGNPLQVARPLDGALPEEIKSGQFVPPGAGSVSGQVLDPGGLPEFRKWITLYCKKPSDPSALYYLGTRTGPDGKFTFRSIPPYQDFQIDCSADIGFPLQTTMTSDVETPWLTLKPGEAKEGIILREEQPSALVGLVTDAAGKPVSTENLEIGLVFDDTNLNQVREWSQQTRRYGWPNRVPANMFGFFLLPPAPFRVRITSDRCRPYLSEPIHLEPGELRFVKIVLRPKTSPAPQENHP